MSSNPIPSSCELTLTRVHPGVAAEQVVEATGWPLRVAADLGVSAPPTDRELDALRALRTVEEAEPAA